MNLERFGLPIKTYSVNEAYTPSSACDNRIEAILYHLRDLIRL